MGRAGHGKPLSLERGVFGSLGLEPGGRALEWCCRDGFNARNFYAHRAQSVTAVDFDPTAIGYAPGYNSSPKVTFELADIREELPAGPFQEVTWDAAIEHFTEHGIAGIVSRIRSRLELGGLLSGCTIVEKIDGKHLPQHEREFHGKEDLMHFLVPAFGHGVVFETAYPSRTNLYFFASDDDAALPFSATHPGSPS